MNLFRKLLPKPKIGVIHISPYLSWGNLDDLNEEQSRTIKRISAKLNLYLDKMVEYGNKRDSWTINNIHYGFATLQQISANWDVDNDSIDLLATGSGGFAWKGSVEQFLGQDNIMKLENRP